MKRISNYIQWKKVGKAYYNKYSEKKERDIEPFCCKKKMHRLEIDIRYCKKCGSYLKIFHDKNKGWMNTYYNPKIAIEITQKEEEFK